MMITAKNRSGTRLAINRAAGYLPNFMELYATKVPPDLYLMQVYTRNVMSKVDDGDWGGAEQDMLKMKTTWSQLLVQLKDDSKAETDKTHMAQLDLEAEPYEFCRFQLLNHPLLQTPLTNMELRYYFQFFLRL